MGDYPKLPKFREKITENLRDSVPRGMIGIYVAGFEFQEQILFPQMIQHDLDNWHLELFFFQAWVF